MPIVLLAAGSAAWIVGQYFSHHDCLDFLLPAGRLALLVGTTAAWAAVYTGSLADAQVVRTLCDPTVVEAHEEYAYTVAWIFTAAVAIDWAGYFIPSISSYDFWITCFVGVALLAGTAYLTYVSHLGARLVYQQGAGVHHPSTGCTEFG